MIKFGPSGNCESFYQDGNTTTEQAAKWVFEKGLNVFEYSFGRGVRLSEQAATVLKDEFNKYEIELTAHAPYYINLANVDDDMAEKSFGYILSSAKKLKEMGGKRVVFHPASLGKQSRVEAFNLTKERFLKLTELIYKNNLDDMLFCPETMGKINQLGDLNEVVQLVKTDKVFLPTIDFGHLNARTLGGLKTEEDFENIIEFMLSELDFDRVSKMHVHFSKIEYSKGGEVRHLTFEDDKFGPDFRQLAVALVKNNLEPVILSESAGTQTEDALKMKKIYLDIRSKI